MYIFNVYNIILIARDFAVRYAYMYMNSLHIVKDSLINGSKTEIIDFFSLVSILSGIFVIISKNPIISVLFLIGLFLSIACYLIVLGLGFIGLSYLLVYVGAVSILFIFILMLINVRISELLSDTNNSIPLAIIIAISFIYPLYQILPYSLLTIKYTFNLDNPFTDIWFNSNHYDNLNKFVNIYNNSAEISFVTANSWDTNLTEVNHIISIGSIMYTNYSIWLIITSVILLLAMVGAIAITIKQKTN